MDFVELRSFDNYIEANIVMNMLLHHDINCHLKDENIITIDPFLSPAIGGMKLMVHYSQAGRARDLLDQAEQTYLKEIPCPNCHAHTLKAVSITRKPSSKFSALVNRLLNVQSAGVRKIFRCGSCGYDLNELPGG